MRARGPVAHTQHTHLPCSRRAHGLPAAAQPLRADAAQALQRLETAAQLEQARGQSFETAADWTRATALAAATAAMLICPTALARLLA